jgi:hypothetical protein
MMRICRSVYCCSMVIKDIVFLYDSLSGSVRHSLRSQNSLPDSHASHGPVFLSALLGARLHGADTLGIRETQKVGGHHAAARSLAVCSGQSIVVLCTFRKNELPIPLQRRSRRSSYFGTSVVVLLSLFLRHLFCNIVRVQRRDRSRSCGRRV